MREKLEELNRRIAADVKELGLMFVNGPGGEEFPSNLALRVDLGFTNRQPRGFYGFAVAQCPTALAEPAQAAQAAPSEPAAAALR